MRGTTILLLASLAGASFCSAQPQNAPPPGQTHKPPKKIWTNADLEALRENSELSGSTPAAPSPEMSEAQAPAQTTLPAEPSEKARDPQWYARQELALQRELAEINIRLDRLRAFRKSGAGATGGLALNQENIGITPEAAVQILANRQAEIRRTINDLDSQARTNGIASGQIAAATHEVEAEEAKAAKHPEAAQEAALAEQQKEQQEELAALQLAEKVEREHNPEAYWRRKFSSVYARLDRAQRELDILQRERNLGQRQYYPDPNKALRQEYTRQDQTIRLQAIQEKRNEINKLRQELSALEDNLRHSGGQPGWSRVD